ncbi:MAG: AAA family ATPase [Bdellovibrionota bacterium]
MKFKRILELFEITKKKSIFLFGPRRTGKSTLLRQMVIEQSAENVSYWDLLDASTYRLLLNDPATLRRTTAAQNTRIVIVDEIQKCPFLLDVVHQMIENDQVHFILSGSSARALRRTQGCLLSKILFF